MRGKMEPTKILRGRLSTIVLIDKTLTISGASADAKATGDAVQNAIQKANEAKTAADNAQAEANKAQGIGQSAGTAAGKAQESADEAKSTADTAKNIANNAQTWLDRHIGNKDNPHCVTAGQLGIEGVEFLVEVGTEWDSEDAPYTQTIVVPGLLETDEPFVDLKDPENYSDLDEAEYTYAQFDKFSAFDNQLVVRSKEKTTMAVTVRLKVYRLGSETEENCSVILAPGPGGAVTVESSGKNYPTSNTELGPAPSGAGKYSLELI